MPNSDDIRWFKEQFGREIEAAVVNTPLDLDMITAIACQETGGIWSVLRKKGLDREEILGLCVGDTLDSDKGRKAFPKTKAELVAAPRGQEMFEIAHAALVAMAKHIAGFQGVAKQAHKFCHGYGIFQLDLQFFKEDPDYFLERRYADFAQCLGRCLGELRRGLKKLGFENRQSLTDLEFAHVAIVYNTGGFKPAKGLKQGHFNGTRFYGEEIFSFVQLSRTVAFDGGEAVVSPPKPGSAVLPPPTPVAADGKAFVVDTKISVLRLRSEPKIGILAFKNVIGQLPDGHPVRAVTGKVINNRWIEVETSLSGANLRGFCLVKFLKAAPATTEIPVVKPAEDLPTTGIIAVLMPRPAGMVTKRGEIANAHSLNEQGQPGRKGTTPAELVAELLDIIDWLAVDSAGHKRYKPRSGLTFCNIYAHDYCHLAGVYLPRVWWTQKAATALAAGESVKPLIGNTLFEVRANDLFRWFADYGPRFGWRQTGTLTKLQQAANEGGVGVIVARRKEENRSGHIVMIVPETGDHTARRNGAGEVVAPLQSQAGTSNFRFGRGGTNWWKHDRFADSAFWIHG